jgi:hypothetical protein
MANITGPMFLTGANAKIVINNKLIAYAADVSYNIDAITIPVEVMGRYEVLSNETIAYGVNGSFTVVRYAQDMAVNAKIDDAAQSGNAADNLGVGLHQNPSKMLESSTFQLDIFQKYKEAADPNAAPAPAGNVSMVGIFTIENCRIVRRVGSLSKRGVLMETYAFVGILGGDMKEDGSGISIGNSVQ